MALTRSCLATQALSVSIQGSTPISPFRRAARVLHVSHAMRSVVCKSFALIHELLQEQSARLWSEAALQSMHYRYRSKHKQLRADSEDINQPMPVLAQWSSLACAAVSDYIRRAMFFTTDSFASPLMGSQVEEKWSLRLSIFTLPPREAVCL